MTNKLKYSKKGKTANTMSTNCIYDVATITILVLLELDLQSEQQILEGS